MPRKVQLSGAAIRQRARERAAADGVEAPAYARRVGETRKPRAPRTPRYAMPALMVDSEGGQDAQGRHHCMLVCAADDEGNEYAHRTGSPLTTYDVLWWLTTQLPTDRLIVGYSLGYDWSMWLRDLSEKERRRVAAGQWAHFDCYALQMLGNRMTVCRFDMRCPRPKRGDDAKRTHAHECSCRTVIVWDVVKFYQASFINAIGHDKGGWRIVTPEELAIIEAGKAGRGGFTVEYAASPECEAYSLAECRVGARLVARLREAVEEALGVPLTQFFGAGSLAKLMMRSNGVEAFLGEHGWPEGTPAWVMQAVMHAYFGGRFEAADFGPVYGEALLCLRGGAAACDRPLSHDGPHSGASVQHVQHAGGARRERAGGTGTGVPDEQSIGAELRTGAKSGARAGRPGAQRAKGAGVARSEPGAAGGVFAPSPGEAPVYEYDLTSAYPAQMATLPCLTHATWVIEPSNIDRHTLCRVRWSLPDDTRWGPFPWRMKDGSIICPRRGHGWYWGEEVLAAKRMYGDAIVVEAKLGIVEACDCAPFEWVAQMFAWRMARGDKNDGPGIVAKLGLNSLYGVCAQGVGSPVWQSFVWAGLITSQTRAMLLDAIARDPDAVFMVATDAVFSTKPLDLASPGLGGWERTEHPDAFVVAPGVAVLGGKVKSRGLAKKEFVEVAPAFVEAWQRVGPMARATAKVRRFVGLRLGLVQPHLYCQWVDMTRDLTIGSGPKREHDGSGGIIPWETPYRTLAAKGPGGMSKAYEPGVLGIEAEDARALRAEMEEQP